MTYNNHIPYYEATKKDWHCAKFLRNSGHNLKKLLSEENDYQNE